MLRGHGGERPPLGRPGGAPGDHLPLPGPRRWEGMETAGARFGLVGGGGAKIGTLLVLVVIMVGCGRGGVSGSMCDFRWYGAF